MNSKAHGIGGPDLSEVMVQDEKKNCETKGLAKKSGRPA